MSTTVIDLSLARRVLQTEAAAVLALVDRLEALIRKLQRVDAAARTEAHA